MLGAEGDRRVGEQEQTTRGLNLDVEAMEETVRYRLNSCFYCPSPLRPALASLVFVQRAEHYRG